MMVVGSRAGSLHLSIYDSFVIGSFPGPFTGNNSSSNLLAQASHPRCSTRSLLMKTSEASKRLYFVPMDLRFVSSSSDYLSLLASRSSALQNLLRYIHEVHRLMVLEWESTRDLPGKFLRNIDEDLQEKENRNIVQALYHSVATGHTFPTVKQWLVDELAERVSCIIIASVTALIYCRDTSDGIKRLHRACRTLNSSSTKTCCPPWTDAL